MITSIYGQQRKTNLQSLIEDRVRTARINKENTQKQITKVADSTIAIPQLTEIEDGEKTDTNLKTRK